MIRYQLSMRFALLLLLAPVVAAQSLEVVGSYKAEGKVSTEIISIQGPTKRAVVSLRKHGVELLDLSDPAKPKRIARHALIEEGWDARTAKDLFGGFGHTKRIRENDPDDTLDEASYRSMWGDWAGREEELYIRCYRSVKKLTQEKVTELMGYPGEAILECLKEAKNDMMESKPVFNR